MSHSHSRSNSASINAITRHCQYFLPGGDLFIMVDNVQFCVHSYFFIRESLWFRDKWLTPATPGVLKPGSSESTAIILSDLNPSEFARFLWVFYNPKFSIYNASVEDWSIILRLAHLWEFHEVKELAVRELEKLDSPDIDRIVLYHDCKVDRNILIPRYAAICGREEPLTLEEGTRLGLGTTLMLARAREYARGRVSESGARSPTSATITQNEMVGLIRQVFVIPPPTAGKSDVTNTITVGMPTRPNTAPTAAANGNATTSTTSSQPPANGNAASSDLLPDVPPKNDTTTASQDGTNGATPQNDKLDRTQSNASTNSAADASKDGGNDGGKDAKIKNKKASTKESKDKKQNSAISDANTSRTTPDIEHDSNKKKSWLKSVVRP